MLMNNHNETSVSTISLVGSNPHTKSSDLINCMLNNPTFNVGSLITAYFIVQSSKLSTLISSVL